MEFKVLWAGFGESCDSWEPYTALLHVDKLHDYQYNEDPDSWGA